MREELGEWDSSWSKDLLNGKGERKWFHQESPEALGLYSGGITFVSFFCRFKVLRTLTG